MFEVYTGGTYARHEIGYKMNRPRGIDRYVLLLLRSESRITIGGVNYSSKPNSVMFIYPNTPYSYYNPHGQYIDDWLHFNGNDSDLEFIDSSAFNRPFEISNPTILGNYIRELLWEKDYAQKNVRNENVDNLLRIILRHIMHDYHSESVESYNNYRFSMQQLRLALQATPHEPASVKEMADKIGISVSYFQHLYKEFFGTTFQAEQIEIRINCAKELILHTDLPLEQIAYKCGYSTEVHFYRQFLSKTGMTPGTFRRQYVK